VTDIILEPLRERKSKIRNQIAILVQELFTFQALFEPDILR